MQDDEPGPDSLRFNQTSVAVYRWLSERFYELHERRERSAQAYRRIFQEYQSLLALNATDRHERSSAVRSLASGRSELALRLFSIGDVDAAIEELRLALNDLEAIEGLETYQLRHGIHQSLGFNYYWRAQDHTADAPNYRDLDLAFKHYSKSLGYGGLAFPGVTNSILERMIDILEANPATAAGSIGLYDILLNIEPEQLKYRHKRAVRIAAIGLRDVLAYEASLGEDASFEDLARAIAACAALQDHDRARKITARGRKMAKANDNDVWKQLFASYRPPGKKILGADAFGQAS